MKDYSTRAQGTFSVWLMLQLDIHTLAIIAIALLFLHSLLIAFFQTVGAGFRDGRYWILAMLTLSLATWLLFLRPQLEIRFIAIFLPNILIVCSFSCTLHGVCRFLERPTPWRAVTSIAVYFTLAYTYLTFFDDRIILRTVIMASITAAFCLLIAYQLFRGLGPPYLRARFFAGFLFIGLLLNDFFRLLWLLYLIRVDPSAVGTELMRLVFFSCIFAAPLISFALIALVAEKEVVEGKRKERQLQEARVRLAEQRAREQREILLRDLHDEIAGSVAAMTMHAKLIERGSGEEIRQSSLKKILSLSQACNREIRTIMNQLEKDVISWTEWLSNLKDYIDSLVEGSDLTVEWKVEGLPQGTHMEIHAAICLLRLFKEAVSNAVRHARATRLTLAIRFAEERLFAEIADNGRGLAPDFESGRGMKHMRLRADELGGRLSFQSSGGLSISLELPLPITILHK